MTFEDLKLGAANKWGRKVRLADALDALPDATALGESFELAFNAYQKRILKLLQGPDLSNRKLRKSFSDQLLTMNLELGSGMSDKDKTSLVLAWAKATAAISQKCASQLLLEFLVDFLSLPKWWLLSSKGTNNDAVVVLFQAHAAAWRVWLQGDSSH